MLKLNSEQRKLFSIRNGNREYDALVNTYGLDPDTLTMIPFYSGVKGEEKADRNI